MLIAQALPDGMVLVSDEPPFDSYGVPPALAGMRGAGRARPLVAQLQ